MKDKKPCRSALFRVLSLGAKLLLVFGYIVGGGFLFQLIENTMSIKQCQVGQNNYEIVRAEHAQELYSYIHIYVTPIKREMLSISRNQNNGSLSAIKFKKLYDDFYSSYNKYIEDNLRSFARKVNHLHQDFSYRGQDCLSTPHWIITNSFLYALTIVTTIGYGHLTTVTWGKEEKKIAHSQIKYSY